MTPSPLTYKDLLLIPFRVAISLAAAFLGLGIGAAETQYCIKVWQRTLSHLDPNYLDPNYHPLIADLYRQIIREVQVSAAIALLAFTIAVVGAVLLYREVKIFDRI